ncbi:DUF226 domain-containing protein [Borreliella lusitaniae]|uniref:DUF226 domain-containing protein n=1 Tax=Borreliella lusitaniae TaxID=100177 RepID=UPI003AB1B0BB
MESTLKIIQMERSKIKCYNKNRFIKIEKENGRTMYHTKIMMDVYKFGAHDKKNVFRLSFRTLFNQVKVEEIFLYFPREDDKFLGIFYGYRKPIKNPFIRYEINGIKKSYSFARAYYMEFRFQKGSVFCYFKGLFNLLKKEKINAPYNIACFDIFTKLEQKVYEFYGKKYPEQGPLTKWIIKNLK